MEQSNKSNVPATRRTLTRRKFIGFALAAVVLGVSIALILGEILLRIWGFAPWREGVDAGHPPVVELDPIMGWRNKPRDYVLRNFAPGGRPIDVTILPDGRRLTGPDVPPGRPIVAIVGCSVTYGWGLTDRDTYAWKLQASNPGLEIRAYGVPGYGTYQSLLALERVLADPVRPAMVLYGFIGHHEERNVAEADWLIMLAGNPRSNPGAGIPYCSLDADGALRRHLPLRYPDFPLKNHSVIANRLVGRWVG